MQRIVKNNFLDFQYKLQEISSTSDSNSHHEEPHIDWEPLWINVENHKEALNICPACCRLVSRDLPQVACNSPSNRLYLAHLQCTNDINQFTEYSQTAQVITNKELFKKSLCRIGCQQYLVQLTFEHPLAPKKFFSFFEKMLESQKRLTSSFNQKPKLGFEPNCIVLPSKEFKCCLKLTPLFSSQEANPQTIYFRIDLTKQNQGIQIVKFQQHGISIVCEFEIIQNQQERKKLVDEMNFKYRRPFSQESFVQFNNFFIEFQSEQCQLNPQTNAEGKYCFQTSQPLEQYFIEYNPPCIINCPSVVENQTLPIDTELLRTIKTQNGSKQFQKKVKDMKNEQIQILVNQILPFLEEIILNDYANYMFQSMLGVCNLEQRMKIIIKVTDILARLVCQQQGTFVFQQLITFLTTKQEFQCICRNSFKNFKIISMDNYGSHFMRKLIQKMPQQMIVMVIPQACENFSELSKNKNAVCVMKCVLKVLHQKEGSSIEVGLQMKKFIDTLTLHTQQLINDEFGNYLIQEAFDLIEESRLSGISQFIVNFFVDSSCSKFANNVVVGCIKKHWRKNKSIFHTLKQKLDHRKIVCMFHQKEGNKILLEILDIPEEIGLKDKINGALRNEEPSKYNSRRWVGLMGKSKTGAVGTNYTSFSEAYSFQKRKNYN